MTRRPVLALGVVLLASCTARRPGVPAADAAPQTPKPEIQVAVDRRVELLAILFRFAGRAECQDQQVSPYERDVEQAFARFADHPAVIASRALAKDHGIGYDAPTSLAVHLDDALRPLGALRPKPAGLDDRWAAVDVEGYLGSVRAFAQDSGFDAFFVAHRAYYEALESRFRTLVAAESVVPWFEAFFGARPGARHVLVPGPLHGGCNFAVTVALADGHEIIYQALGLEAVDAGGLPHPGALTLAILVHEMAHAYVNPLVARHAAVLEPGLARLFGIVEVSMREVAYPTWRIVAGESIVRAATQLYLRERKGKAAATRDLRFNHEQSFLWIADLADVLAACRASTPPPAPAAEACLPDVARFFEALAARYATEGGPRASFFGPLNAALRQRPLTLVVPGASIAPRLAPDVAKIHARFFAAATLVRLEGAAPPTPAPTALVLYGSPTTNPLVADLVAAAGWTIGEDEIAVAGQVFKGKGLVLIACRPHPKDPTLGVAVYTGAHDDDLVSINALFHGPTDWVVGRRRANGSFEPVASGDFDGT